MEIRTVIEIPAFVRKFGRTLYVRIPEVIANSKRVNKNRPVIIGILADGRILLDFDAEKSDIANQQAREV